MTPRTPADDTGFSRPDVPDELVDRLYGLPLDEFVPARDAAGREARTAGDRAVARRISALPKPTVAAWVVDQAVRTVPHAVDAVVAIGDDLRDATARRDRERLVTLDRERRRVLDALLAGVADTVRPGGRPASEATLRAVRDTFVAAVADPGAAAAVRAGRLARALEHVGFGLVDETGASVELPAAAERPLPDAAEVLDHAEEALDVARAVRERRRAALAEATDALDRANAAVADLEAELAGRRADREARAAAADDARESLAAQDAEVARREDAVTAADEAAKEARRRRRAARHQP